MPSAYDPPDKLEWEDPGPGSSKKGSKWDPVARTLRAHPGKWACIGRDIPTSIISIINRGQLKCFRPKGTFEAVTRNHTGRWQADVYARYVGENGGARLTKQKATICGGCHGVIQGSRRFSLETSIANHLKTCPSRIASIKQEEKK